MTRPEHGRRFLALICAGLLAGCAEPPTIENADILVRDLLIGACNAAGNCNAVCPDGRRAQDPPRACGFASTSPAH